MEIAKGQLQSELKRGVLELVVLRVLGKEAAYGYRLVREIAERSEGELEIREGTLYPLLYRLEEQGLVETEWHTPEGRGRARKYYRATLAGRKRLLELQTEWRDFVRRVDALLEEPSEQKEMKGAGDERQ